MKLPRSSAHSHESNVGYRRGFVLGLTLAEAALLLLFVLMLLMVIGFERRDQLLAQFRSLEQSVLEVLPQGEDYSYIISEIERLQELQNVAANAGHQWNDDFIELVRHVAEASATPGMTEVREALERQIAEYERRLQIIEQALGEGQVEEVAELVVEQETLIRNQRGQLVDLRRRLGNGVFPNCWTNEDGSFDYILDVVLDSNGIKGKDSTPPHRMQERLSLPLPSFQDVRLLTAGEFLTETRGIYNWSVANECRFYVSIYDGTQLHEKELYKELMRTVEGHFYKRQLNDVPPF